MDFFNFWILYVGMWMVECKFWIMIDGSEEGGVWKIIDGGEIWKKFIEGLFDGLVGRVGVIIFFVNLK